MRSYFINPHHRSRKRRDITNWVRVGEEYVGKSAKVWSDWEYARETGELYVTWIPFAVFCLCAALTGRFLIHA